MTASCNLTRRHLLASALASPLSAESRKLRAGCQTNAWRIRPGHFDDFLSVLDRIRAHRYHGFETSFRNLQARFDDPGPARAAIEKRGLSFLGCHIFLLQYDPATLIAPEDLIESVAKGAAALGAERLILSARAAGRDSQALEAKARALTKAGALCRKRNLRLCYHNHDAEFRNGGAEMDFLLRRADPELVSFVIDGGHAIVGGADLVEFFESHADRIDGIHLRDYKGPGYSGPLYPGDDQVPLGMGRVDWKPLHRTIRRERWRGWLINEEERLNDGRPGDEAVAPARTNLKKIFGV